MSPRPAHWMGAQLVSQLRSFVRDLSRREIGDIVQRSAIGEAEITGSLPVIFHDGEAGPLAAFNAALARHPRYKAWQVEMEVRRNHVAQPAGDLAIVARVDVPGVMQFQKGLLFSCYRLYPDGGAYTGRSRYSHLTGEAAGRAMSILNVTPAAFFLLYHPPVLHVRQGRERELEMWSVPALTIMGRPAGRFPPDAGEMLPLGQPLSTLLVRDFLGCITGDPTNPNKVAASAEYVWEIRIGRRPERTTQLRLL